MITVTVAPAELDNRAPLIARVNAMLDTDPGAEVLVKVEEHTLSAHQAGCLLVLVASLPKARLADTLVFDDDSDVCRCGHDAGRQALA
jgi:hypothetical protein